MGLTAGEVETVFRARDEMSAVAEKSGQAVVLLTGRIAMAQAEAKNAATELRLLTAAMVDGETAGRNVSAEFDKLSQRVADSKAQLSSLRGELKDATTPAIKDAGESSKTTGDMFGQLGSAVKTAAAAFGIYASARGIVSAIETTVEFGLNIERIAQQIGTTTDFVQMLSFMASQTAIPFERLSQTVSQFQRKLALDTPAAMKAVEDLGLSWNKLKTESPDKAFDDVATAISKVTDQEKFAGDAAELFNSRSGTSVAAVLKNWDELKKKQADANITLTHDHVEALANMAKAWDTATTKVKIYFAEVLLGLSKGRKDDDSLPGLKMGIFKDPAPLTDAQQYAAARAKIPASPANPFLSAAAPSTPMQDNAINEPNLFGGRSTVSGNGVSGLDPIDPGTKKGLADILALDKELATEITTREAISKAADTAALARLAATLERLKLVTKENEKAYGTQEQIARLQALDKAEMALSAAVFNELTQEKDRIKVVEDAAKRHLELQSQIIAKENERAKIVTANVVAEFEAQKRMNAAHGLDAGGTPIRPDDPARDAMNKIHDIQASLPVDDKGQTISSLGDKRTAEVNQQFLDDALKAAQADDALAAAAMNASTKANQLSTAHTGAVAAVVTATGALSSFHGVIVGATNAMATSFSADRNPTNSVEAYLQKQDANASANGVNYNATAGLGDQVRALQNRIGTAPKFAHGGSADTPTLAWIGDGGEREYVVPESNIAKGGSGGGGGDVHVHEGAVQIVNPIMNDPRAMLMIRQAVGAAFVDGQKQRRHL